MDAAREAGLELPAACIRGWCAACAGRIVEGDADASEALRCHDEDAAGAGFVPRGTAHPPSELVVVTHRKDEMRAHRRSRDLSAPRG